MLKLQSIKKRYYEEPMKKNVLLSIASTSRSAALRGCS